MESTKLINLIGSSCEEALAAEVSATPKPGLVDKNNSGAHRDMDFTTFMDSISAISPAFFEFARLGTGLETLDENSLAKIRPLGIKYEKAMFDATKGVNTHKGAIFSLGIIAAAAGHCGFIRGDLQAETVCAAASIIAG
ncbi:MAG: triphosphoribosyl-dephospho-CoA synthase, partial [Oscillospiraceae bacterium]